MWSGDGGCDDASLQRADRGVRDRVQARRITPSWATAIDPATMNDARLWHPWLRINRVPRVMLHTRWSAEAWSVVRVECSGERFRFGARPSVLETRSAVRRNEKATRGLDLTRGLLVVGRTARRFFPLAHRTSLFHYELQGRWH